MMSAEGISHTSFAYDSALNMPSASRLKETALQMEGREERMTWLKLMHVRLSYHLRLVTYFLPA